MKFFPLALLFSGAVFFSVTAHAQVAAQTSIPADLALGGDAKTTEGSTSEMISPDTIQFPNNPVSDFLMVYEKLKGVTLIKDASLLAGGANLSLTLNQPVSKAEAIRLLESTLLLNGYAFIAVDKNSVKVINAAGGKNPRSEGVFLFTNESELPEGEVVASYVLPLTHLAASDAVEIFNQFIVLHPYGSMVAVPVANQVVITENSTLIRRLIDVKNLIDIPAPEKKSEFITLAQANADRVVELITTILEKRQEGGSGGSGKAATGQAAQPPVPGLQALGGGATGVTISGGKSGFAGDIQLIADTRTNRILVIASPFDFTAIQALIQQFDIAVELTDPYEHSLNYVAATDMLQILGDMLKEEGDEGGDGVAGGSQSTGKISGGIGTGGVVAGGGSSGSSSSGGRKADVLSEPGEEQAADSLIVGKTKLIADNRANSILVIGQPEAKDKVKAILTKLDKKPMQVYLATVIGQLQVSNDDEFAVNILQKYIGGSRTGAASVAGGKPFISGTKTVYGTDVNGDPTEQTQTGTTPIGPAAATLAQMSQVAVGALPGMQIATFILGSIDLYINALTATTRFRIASRPAVFTANNKKATIYNGQKIAIPTSTVTTLGGGGSATATSGSQQSNIQYQDVVLKIEVVPLINSAKEISLQIVQTNDTLSQNSQAIGGGVNVPDINTQELNTTVIVPDRATVLLGGLVTQQDTKNVAGVPFLSTIPLMGNLFKSTSDITNRQELVVMIQPTVVQDNKELSEASKTERDLTGFSAKELQPLTMRSGSKSKDVGLQAAGTDSVPAEEPKQE
ncbi:type_II_gspD, type II secretion system protein D [Candidatus Methylacidiphilaceae bacterium]